MPPSFETELAFLSLEQAASLLRKKEISPTDLVQAALSRIERFNRTVGAFITITAERAKVQAGLAEKRFRQGKADSLLCGIPVSLKDNFWTRGVRTTAGSKILSDFIPPKDSDVANKLLRAGAILLGKTNMHEFAYGITNENPHYGPVRNPWNLEHISGGSSGGSAAALALGIGYGSIGTDTGGSIRIPSALCGTVGLKPTFGLVSVEGVVPLAKTLDHAGPLARSVTDVCIMLEAIVGIYPNGIKPPDFRKLRKSRRHKFRLGLPKQHFFECLDTEVRNAVDSSIKSFESLGATIEEVSLPHVSDSVEPTTNIALAEATQYHESQGYFPSRAAEYGEDVRCRLEMGCHIRAVDYLNAFATKQEMTRDFELALNRVDAILTPALPIAAPRLGEKEVTVGTTKEAVRSALIRFNRSANVTGHPAISILCGFTSEGLPIGLQLIGPFWGEARLLTIALAYEDSTKWLKRSPDLATRGGGSSAVGGCMRNLPAHSPRG